MAAVGTGLSTVEVFRAYLDCRQRKRSSSAAVVFEMSMVANVCRITRELRSMAWEPGSSMCFAVTVPKPREVWAAAFDDRVVHHVIYNRLRPRIEPTFIPTSFACIPGRGTGRAVAWASRAARRVTAGWTREAWALQLDVRNFFTSISRPILLDMLQPHCPEPWLWHAVERVFLHDVTENAHFPGDPAQLALVPLHKSLWHAPAGVGLPIGNLTSQFAANVYMNALDHFIVHEIRPRFYGRYVDDLLLFDTDRGKLRAARDAVTKYAAERLALTMHPGKTRLQRVAHGVDFVGARIMPHRTYVRRSTAVRASRAIAATPPEDLLATANAYLGIASAIDSSWNLRGKWTAAAVALGLVASPDRRKVLKRPEIVEERSRCVRLRREWGGAAGRPPGAGYVRG